MNQRSDVRSEALLYHQRLPERLWKYLNGRGITNSLIHEHLLGWNGQRITIPIPDREGRIAFFKLAKDPGGKSDTPKMLSTPGAHAELYGWEQVLAKPHQIIICEGEFDRLVLERQGFAAVTSTAGAAVFRPEWAEALRGIPSVYVCFDNDAAGRAGTERVGRLNPHARIVLLPAEVGEHGDVSDFFVRLRCCREGFVRLLELAKQVAAPNDQPSPGKAKTPREPTPKVESKVKIEELVGRYLTLQPSGKNLIARCPFHEDNHPSFVVFPATQSFHCFVCYAHGDAAGFLMRKENLTFPEALHVIREITQ